MRAPGPSDAGTATRAEERGAALALLPVAATLDYYALPEWLQAQWAVQFAPQILAYLALALWASRNDAVLLRLGLAPHKFGKGLAIGLIAGFLLGGLNSFVILTLVPYLGFDLTFLKQTPHAHVPPFLMVPWFIAGIAIFVEINFRGFLLGRLVALESGLRYHQSLRRHAPLALITGALVFAFDPFMVNTFRHLHWIALWDGLIWGIILQRTKNLYATIAAHAVEVIVMYCAIRSALMS